MMENTIQAGLALKFFMVTTATTSVMNREARPPDYLTELNDHDQPSLLATAVRNTLPDPLVIVVDLGSDECQRVRG